MTEVADMLPITPTTEPEPVASYAAPVELPAVKAEAITIVDIEVASRVHAGLLDSVLRAEFPDICTGISEGSSISTRLHFTRKLTDEETTRLNVKLREHDPVFITVNKELIRPDGTEVAQVHVHAPKLGGEAITLLVGDTPVAVNMVLGHGMVSIVCDDPTEITVKVQNADRRTTDEVVINRGLGTTGQVIQTQNGTVRVATQAGVKLRQTQAVLASNPLIELTLPQTQQWMDENVTDLASAVRGLKFMAEAMFLLRAQLERSIAA